jgi:hypothetical protein
MARDEDPSEGKMGHDQFRGRRAADLGGTDPGEQGRQPIRARDQGGRSREAKGGGAAANLGRTEEADLGSGRALAWGGGGLGRATKKCPRETRQQRPGDTSTRVSQR